MTTDFEQKKQLRVETPTKQTKALDLKNEKNPNFIYAWEARQYYTNLCLPVEVMNSLGVPKRVPPTSTE